MTHFIVILIRKKTIDQNQLPKPELKSCVIYMCTVYIWDNLRDLTPFSKFKKRRKHLCRSVTFSKLQDLACDFTRSNTLRWVFFTFFKWYQIAQHEDLQLLKKLYWQDRYVTILKHFCKTFFLSLDIKNEILVRFKVLRIIGSSYICITALTLTSLNTNTSVI